MKKNTFKIGWQKYEDVMEKQLSCPMLKRVMENIASQNFEYEDDDIQESKEDFLDDKTSIPPIVPISEELLRELTVLSNFDCWMGHTNFDVTPAIREKLNKIPGVEVLKICSRYRFFIGVGSMFNFPEVRKNIESTILPKGD